MKNVFKVFFYVFGVIFYFAAYAQNPNLSLDKCDQSLAPNITCAASGVVIFAPGSSTPSFNPPSNILPIGQLQLTYSVKLYSPSSTSFTYNSQNWGIRFVDSGGANPVTYYGGGGTANGDVAVTVDASKIRQISNIFVGTVVVTLDFSNANLNSRLPDKVSQIINANSLALQPYYYDTTNPNLKFYWQADLGAILAAPTISVNSQDSAFVVTLNPPSSFAAANVNTGKTALTSVTPNALSGYVIVYWLDTDANGQAAGCKASPSKWQFLTNSIATNNATQSNPLSCLYTNYLPSFHSGGISPALNCPANPSILPFDTALGGATLTSDAAAVPNSNAVPSQFSSDSDGTPIGCYYVVYVPSSRSTWSKGNLKNGEIYGIMAWALNSGYDTANGVASPKYSLAHSNISYVSPVHIPLASTDKTPDLPVSQTDCFIVTAASGDSNSESVFYWRVLRDEYLTPLGITSYYYNHASKWANWLNEHPKLKPIAHFVFEKSGKAIYHSAGVFKTISNKLNKFFKGIKNIFIQEASAQELSVDQKIEEKKYQQPNYEIFMTAGILYPTQDKKYYDKYYSSQSTLHFEAGATYLYWVQNLGFSVGLLGRYLTNTNNDSVMTNTGVTQNITRNLYSLTGELIAGVRYRHPSFLYLQPGVYIGAGATRLREEAKSGNAPTATDGSNQTMGVTVWSPIYEVGANLDISLIALASAHPWELGSFLNDVLIRSSLSYNVNPSKAISSTGMFVQAGFVFLLN